MREGHVTCSSGAGTKNQLIKAKIDKQPVSPKCRLCGAKKEPFMHLVYIGCPKQYKRRHDNVARRVHWEVCKKHGLEISDRWYEHTPADVVVEKAIQKWTIIGIQVTSM